MSDILATFHSIHKKIRIEILIQRKIELYNEFIVNVITIHILDLIENILLTFFVFSQTL